MVNFIKVKTYYTDSEEVDRYESLGIETNIDISVLESYINPKDISFFHYDHIASKKEGSPITIVSLSNGATIAVQDTAENIIKKIEDVSA